MSELSDYQRLVERPHVEKLEGLLREANARAQAAEAQLLTVREAVKDACCSLSNIAILHDSYYADGVRRQLEAALSALSSLGGGEGNQRVSSSNASRAAMGPGE